MPRKRDRFLKVFNLSRNGSHATPQLPVRQPGSSKTTNVDSTPQSSSSTTTPDPQLSPLLVSRVTPSIKLPGNQSPPSPYSGVKEAAGATWEGVKTALVILKESSDWLPQLKAATGGLVAVIDAVELTSANMADLEMLRQKIDGLTSIVKENNRDRTFPWLRRRLSEFAEKLNEIVKNVDEKSNHGRLRRFAEGKKDKGEITSFACAILDLVTNLQSELSLYSSRGINELLSNEALKKLKESEAAHYDTLLAAKLVQRRACTPNTRQNILEDLLNWAKDPESSRMYWMNGMAGTGKTTIAYTFCEQLQEKGLLGANFFCSRSLAECSDIRYIIPTTACHLARSYPQFASVLVNALGGDFQLSSRLPNQLKQLLSEPFQHISEAVTDTLIIVIDALDECRNEASEIRLFLEQICDYFVTKTIPLKIFVSSRPEDAIRHAITPLKPTSPSGWSVVHIHDIEESLVQADIKIYVEDELSEISKSRRLEAGWPPSTEVDAIVGNSNRLFIYAATVIRYVKVNAGNPRRRLLEMASTSQVGKGTSQSPSPSTELIDELYRTILERAFHEKNQEEKLVARIVLKLIVCAQTPLTLSGIADLLNASGEFEIEISISDVRTALELLPAVISTPVDDDGVATTFHASFPDFLFNTHRCGSINHIPLRQSYQDLARICLHFIDKALTIDNISGSDRWQTVSAITKENKVESWISSALAYACMFWASHIGTDDEIEGLSTELDRFLSRQVLRWFEVLSLLKRLDIGIESLRRMKERKHPTLSSSFEDAYKFLKDIFDIIHVCPCEVYHSGLVWAPERSFIRKTYLKTGLARMVCGRRVDWGTFELTIRTHSAVLSVALSPDNRRIVSGSYDDTVRIWNLSTGEEERVLRGHSGPVQSVAISSDNRHIVSGSRDNTIRTWNASTGEEEHVLRGHFELVYSIAVSSNHRYIVSGSHDKTVRIWNMSTGEVVHVLQGHSGWVNTVAISPDGHHVVSGSWDNTVRIWDISTGEEKHVLRGHSDAVYSVTVSSNNHFISGSNDKTIRIWNMSTGEEVHVLRGHSKCVNSLAVSFDNRLVVSGSQDETVRIWNMSTGEEEHVFQGHSGMVYSVAVSPDARHVVFGSQDNTIRIWNVSTAEEHVVRGHSGSVSSVAILPDHRHVVSGSRDETFRVWNTSTGEEEHVFGGHSGWVYTVAFSPDNYHVVSGSLGGTIRIWNISTNEEEHVLPGHSDCVSSITVSFDNCHLISGSWDSTVRIWNMSTGEEERVLRGHSGPVLSVAVSPDNVVSGSHDKTIRIWNASTGEEEGVLRGHVGEVSSVAISPDKCHVVSGSDDMTVRIWNIPSGEEQPPLVISFVVSSDNCRVMSGPQPETIPIGHIFLFSMVALLAAQADNIMSIPIIERLVSGESLDLDIFLQSMRSGPSPVPIALTPDGSTILLSNGKKCLAIPSTLRDISRAAFFGSKVCFGHGSGRITILDIST